MAKITKSVQLQNVRNEKDVENAYRGSITMQVPQVAISSPYGTDGYARWGSVRALLEFKYDVELKQRRDQCGVLGQMILYLKKFEQDGQTLPNVLFVGDKNECFALETTAVQEFLDLPIDWSIAPSKGSPDLTKALITGLTVSPYVFDPTGDFRKVLDKIEVLAKGEVYRVRATQKNISAMFAFWEDNIFLPTSGLTPTEQVDVFLKCLFQPDDVLQHRRNKNILVVEGKKVPIRGHQWRSFTNHFVQGYKPSEVEAFYASKDRLIEDDARRRQGAFFTPTIWVDEAHQILDRELGSNWRDECVVWDPACGTGNLTRDYAFSDLLLSTLEQVDVDVIHTQGYNPGAEVFQYDFLNDPVPRNISRKLRAYAKEGKRLVIFMNPPYAEDGVGSADGATKGGVALTKVNAKMQDMGRAARQLYAQFMYHSSKIAAYLGFEKVTIATFSVPTFMCSGSYKKFREFWYNSFEYKAGMLFQASHFADVSGRWGISFTVWSSGKTALDSVLPVELKDVQNFEVVPGATKSFYNSDGRQASKWVEGKQVTSGDSPKFSSGLKVRDGAWNGGSSSGSLGVMCSKGNNLVDSGTGCMLLPGKPTDKGRRHFDLLTSNWRRATALFAARKLVTETWQNQKDEYLAPNTNHPSYDQWNDDAIVYALLHNSNNCTAMRDVRYKGKDWRIKNNFWWKTLAESKALYNHQDCGSLYADVRGESTDSYLATILPTLNLGSEAKACLDQLDLLLTDTLPYREAFSTARPELHLGTHDAGLYQLKHLFREYELEGWKYLQTLLKELADKLRPGVYDFGFLLK